MYESFWEWYKEAVNSPRKVSPERLIEIKRRRVKNRAVTLKGLKTRRTLNEP